MFPQSRELFDLKVFEGDDSRNTVYLINKESFKPLQPRLESLANKNAFCPLCSKFVSGNAFYYFSKLFNRNYLAHNKCLENMQQKYFETLIGEPNYSQITAGSQFLFPRSISFSGREFYLEMQISHPLSNLIFIKVNKKLKSIGHCIQWHLSNFDQTDSYYPNTICLPAQDFEVSVQLTQIATKNGSNSQKIYVNASNLLEAKWLTAEAQSMALSIKVYHQAAEKEQVVERMNYKYRYDPQLPLPILEFVHLKINVQETQSDDEEEEQKNHSITELLDEHSNGSTMKSSSVHISLKNEESVYSEKSQRSFEKERVDLNKLISTHTLSAYVQNSTLSRIFQIFLNEANLEEINLIITALYSELPELVKHEYANYMVQKLFAVCDATQRLRLMEKLFPDLPIILKNKQGTHTLQTLIALFTQSIQFKLVCEAISEHLWELSTDPHATHFIQKLVTLFPFTNVLQLFNFVNDHFLKFALDKNAMCVIKQILKRLKSMEEDCIVDIIEAKKKMLHSVTFNVDGIIHDSYGNYILQFCYQLFGEERCLGITEMIIKRFAQFSMQRFSTSVVLKCVGSFWSDKSTFDRLRSALTAQDIIVMYRNRDGNKILLEIMQRRENSSPAEKIKNLLTNSSQSAKFNHDRWGLALGIRSGNVGINCNSFTEAIMNKSSPNKGKKKLYISANVN